MAWAILVVLLALFALGGGDVVIDVTRRGRRLTSTTDGDRRTPAELAAAASAVVGRHVTTDAYVLARMIRSEGGHGNLQHKAALAHVALNDARELGWPLVKTLLYDRNDRDGERIGEQRGGRYATSRDPYEVDLTIAEAVLSGTLADPTHGAVKFVHVSAFGIQPGTSSYDDIVVRWAREGLRPFEVDGAGTDLRVFRRVAAAATGVS